MNFYYTWWFIKHLQSSESITTHFRYIPHNWIYGKMNGVEEEEEALTVLVEVWRLMVLPFVELHASKLWT